MIKKVAFSFLYLYAFLIGIAWTTVPALSTVLTSASCENLSSTEYGGLTLALVISAIFSSILSGTIFLRFGMRRIFLAGVLFILGATLVLFASHYSLGLSLLDYLLLLSSQFLLGAGIGASLTALNVYIVSLVEKYTASFLVALYACMGLGSTYAPLYFAKTLPACQWQFRVLFLSLFSAFLFLFFLRFLPFIQSRTKIFKWEKVQDWRFWAFALLPLLYGIIEEAFAVWGPVGLFQSSGWTRIAAEHGLAYFWGSVTFFQVFISVLCFRISPKWIYFLLPGIIALAFYLFSQGASLVDMPWIFALAGMGCSAFYSLTVHFGEKQFPKIVEVVSGTFVSAYMIGSGLSALGIGIIRQYLGISFSMIFTGMIFFAFAMWFASVYLVSKSKTA